VPRVGCAARAVLRPGARGAGTEPAGPRGELCVPVPCCQGVLWRCSPEPAGVHAGKVEDQNRELSRRAHSGTRSGTAARPSAVYQEMYLLMSTVASAFFWASSYSHSFSMNPTLGLTMPRRPRTKKKAPCKE